MFSLTNDTVKFLSEVQRRIAEAGVAKKKKHHYINVMAPMYFSF